MSDFQDTDPAHHVPSKGSLKPGLVVGLYAICAVLAIAGLLTLAALLAGSAGS